VQRLALIALAATLLTGCGGDAGTSSTSTDAAELAVPWIDPDGDPPIVGGLTVNPADGTLLMTTNTGIFRVEQDAEKPEAFTGMLDTPDGSGKLSAALVTRFVEPDTLLGSGHPASGESLPAALGLIRSEDAGKTWSSVSELGKSDFHAIETSGKTIVGALFGQPQVLVSQDDGRTWTSKAAPLPIVAMEVDRATPTTGSPARRAGSSSPRTAGRRGARSIRRRTCASPGQSAATCTGSTRAAT
jgi:hypothetical protein